MDENNSEELDESPQNRTRNHEAPSQGVTIIVNSHQKIRNDI
jgi:hypothetical protein